MNYQYMSITQPDEHTFLCGYNRVRRYGTTANLSYSKPCRYIEYTVLPDDTIQGIALKHNSSVSQIVRLNKLWSSEALHLRQSIRIPIVDDINEPSSNIDIACFGQDIKSKNSPPPQRQEESVQSILCRIDETIKSTSKSVKNLENYSYANDQRERDKRKKKKVAHG